ncbi:porin [Chitinophaga tropicalis]|uniref:Outer membrane beta-barrel protein n=1 Tax=Chitinophaga tropicalis TaxID=2683588 RepID=A0A7K1TXY4_9BACT|nr:porin [Chitinophaga tropicalis]MVT06943.1 outer membrane beta-barrel protein [Chitinophaga tropicalis]
MKKVLLAVFAACQVSIAFSQTADTTQAPAFKLSGSADVYYKYNFNGNVTDNKTSFTNSHNSFELGMISLKAEHEFKKGSIVADLGFGRRAAEFSYNETTDKKNTAELAIKQLYIGYQVLDKLKISMGSFATHVGYELLDAYLNRNYSMSYMFSNGPFFSTGVKADITINKSLTAMVGVFNPTDFKSASWSNHKYIGAQLGYTSTVAPVKLYLNYLEGKDTIGIQNHQVDLVAIYQVNNVIGLGYNGTVSTYNNTRDKESGEGTKKWWGSALYVNLDFNPNLGLTLRGEYFDDSDALKTHAGREGGNIVAGTLSFNYKVGNLTIIPEFRVDKASTDIFNKKSGAATSTSPNVLLAATYHF